MMQALAGQLLLEAWERGAAESELERPLRLLATALGEPDGERLAQVPIAERDRLLLELHELSFGPRLEMLGRCSECDAPFELSVPVAELTASEIDGRPLVWDEEERRYRLRPATTTDLLATLELDDVDSAAALLLSRCLDPSPHDSASPTSLMALEKFEQLHAPTELSCTVECPDCSHAELVDLDPARFVWVEVRRAAGRLLREIHELARAYGWSEHAILGMTGQRRHAYLELLGE
jgi:hypothetical protein